MLKRVLAVAAVLAAVSGTAFASSCPRHMKEIDAALAGSPQISAAQMEEVKALRKAGEDHHNAGRHAESEEALHKAKKILGLE